MKKRLYKLITLLLILFITGCSEKEDTIGVNALAADPMAFTGEIAVEGVVQSVDEENCRLILIDVAEYETCGLYPCAGAGILPAYLPDETKPMGPTPSNYVYSGEMPKLEQTVVAIGTIVSHQNQLFFEIEEVRSGSKVISSRN